MSAYRVVHALDGHAQRVELAHTATGYAPNVNRDDLQPTSNPGE
jgi:hypothetical protein